MEIDPREFERLDAEYKGVATHVKHMASGKIRSLIVNGPPGVGKSYMVKQFLSEYPDAESKVVAGHITMLSLYHALYSHRNANQVLVLDDTDSVFSKIEGLNLLKAAMDTQKVRQVSWESKSAMLDALKLPMNFKFNGAVILITNVGFTGPAKLAVHLTALKDRAYCVQIGDRNKKSAFHMIAYMVLKQDMLRDYDFDIPTKQKLLDYLAADLDTLTTVSLRTMMKLADLYRLEPTEWRELADASLRVL